jgi:leucyl aminopeptidase
VFLARDVVTEPPNVLYPESYAKIIKNELSKEGVSVKILGEKQMHKLGMGALLGVGQGSERESQMVVMEWKGDKSSKEGPIAFVGKGVTFDTGGISLKSSGGMEDMKYDMGGSASVVGVMKALAARKAKVNAVGIVGLVENMPDGLAQRPSDVVVSMSGQTVAVLNTDAEGRLVLADTLWYCQETYKPHTLVNLATLTGAIVVALANQHAGIFSNSDTLAEKISNAGKETDEKVWRLPLNEQYDKMIDSEIADMQNISSGKGAGSITAAQFLKRFVQEGVEWTHIDIAGMAWADKELDTCPKGATGYGVRLLDRLVKNHYEAK